MSNQHVKKSYNYSYVIKYETCTLTCFKDVLLFKKINMLNVDEKDIKLFIYLYCTLITRQPARTLS